MQKNGVVWGGYGALKVTDNVTIRQSAYDFLFDFNRNHASILYRFEIQPVICRKSTILTHPTCIWRPVGGDPGGISRRSLASENQSPWAIVWCCLCDPTFSRFSRTLTCVGRTDRRTDTTRAWLYQYRGCIAWRVKNLPLLRSASLYRFLMHMYIITSLLKI